MGAKYKQVETINEFIDAIRLRVDAFIKEQGFQPGLSSCLKKLKSRNQNEYGYEVRFNLNHFMKNADLWLFLNHLICGEFLILIWIISRVFE
ncbi:MAG: hypothetical protein V1859_05930 [archaeon]